MTAGKVIERLVEFGPTIIEPHTRMRAHCVLSTAVGVDVLRAFAIDARPVSVHIRILNKILVDALERLPPDVQPDWRALGAAGGWALETGDPADPISGTAQGTDWNGHLVIHVPAVQGGGLINLNLGAMARPAKQIYLPSAGSFRFRPPQTTYNLPDGTTLFYALRPDDTSYADGPDWKSLDRRQHLVAALTRAIRKGRI